MAAREACPFRPAFPACLACGGFPAQSRCFAGLADSIQSAGEPLTMVGMKRVVPAGRRVSVWISTAAREVRTVSAINSLAAVVIRSPILWGAAAAFCFYSLIHGGMVDNPLVVRYLAGHWVEYVEVGMFFVGTAALVLRLQDVFGQRRRVGSDPLGPIPAGGQTPEDVEALLEQLDDSDAGERLSGRLRTALDFVRRTGSANELEDHLKYLADIDAARASQSYGLVRFIIWAIPIMGFLGTVIGITVAIANLSPSQMENITDVVAGLGTAFDTTATALGLSMVLMFSHFVVDRQEQSLLQLVDDAAWTTLAGRFQTIDSDNGTAFAMARLSDAVGRSSARLLESQERAWRNMQSNTQEQLATAADLAGSRMAASIAAAVDSVLAGWGDRLQDANSRLLADREDRWASAGESMATAMQQISDLVVRMDDQQRILVEQGEVLGRVVEATRDLAALERTLARNLETAAASARFEETLNALGAAVQLLASRTGAVRDADRLGNRDAAPIGKAA